MILYQGQPGTTDTELFAADRRITSYTVVGANISNAAATFRIHHCVAGAAAADANIVVPDIQVPAHQLIAIDLPLELRSGDVLRASQGTVRALTVTVDGTDLT